MSPRIVAIVIAIGVSALAAAPAAAQSPSQGSVTATGVAFVVPQPSDRMNNASIATAVAQAHQQVIPLAVAAARTRAQQIADAAGLQLGALRSVSDSAPSPYGPFGGPFESGTFGPGRYCGDVPRFRTRRAANGVRRRVRVGTRRVCRVPPRVYASLNATFDAAAK